MSRPLLILRPQPGAAATAARAADLGLETFVAPLFEVRPVAWSPPDPSDFDAVLLTSANALRHGGAASARLSHLPAFAVGTATAEAARQAGFSQVEAGSDDAASIVAIAAEVGVTRLLHLAGREHKAVAHARVTILRRIVYAAEAATHLPPPAQAALGDGAVALLHSPRAATLFRALLDAVALAPGQHRIAAISAAALTAAGSGWERAIAAESPDDAALLAAARSLCD